MKKKACAFVCGTVAVLAMSGCGNGNLEDFPAFDGEFLGQLAAGLEMLNPQSSCTVVYEDGNVYSNDSTGDSVMYALSAPMTVRIDEGNSRWVLVLHTPSQYTGGGTFPYRQFPKVHGEQEDEGLTVCVNSLMYTT